MKRVTDILEYGLWRSRLMVLVAVLASLVLAAGVIYLVTVDVLYLFGDFRSYASPALGNEARATLRLGLIAAIVGIVDGYLLAAVLVVFALGLYELFVGNLVVAEQSAVAARLLQVRNIDDLKEKLGRVVLLILVVKFLQQALALKYQSPLDLLYLAVGTALMGLALFLTTAKKNKTD